MFQMKDSKIAQRELLFGIRDLDILVINSLMLRNPCNTLIISKNRMKKGSRQCVSLEKNVISQAGLLEHTNKQRKT